MPVAQSPTVPTVAEADCTFCRLAAEPDDDLVIVDDGTWFVVPSLLQRAETSAT
jgi:hypothetical protein